MRNKLLLFLPLLAALAPPAALAHEVYVLDPATIASSIGADSPNPFSAFWGNEYQFFFWGLVSFVAVSTILAATLFRVFEKSVDPLLFGLKRCALPVVRITAGLCLVSFGIEGSLYGPELPLVALFGALAGAAAWSLIALGAALVLGAYTRIAAIGALFFYLFAALMHGYYALTYADHLGAALALLILGGGTWSLGSSLRDPLPALKRLVQPLAPLAFPLLRMSFGFGVMFAAVYAKYIHSELALQVVLQYDLTRYFPFEPLFIVLGALIIEFLAGLMLFMGVALRWTVLFLGFWLTLSLFYFQEAVWPHLILFGLAVAVFCHGYDRYSLEGLLLKRRGSEPVL